VVSEILRGKRELNLRQIRALARRFHLPAAAFFSEIEPKRCLKTGADSGFDSKIGD
jgi:hypothetical protein